MCSDTLHTLLCITATLEQARQYTSMAECSVSERSFKITCDVFCHNEQRLIVPRDLFKHRKDVLHLLNFLVRNQDSGILHLNQHAFLYVPAKVG